MLAPALLWQRAARDLRSLASRLSRASTPGARNSSHHIVDNTQLIADHPAPQNGRFDRIIAAALTEFAQHGYEAARLGDIAHRAGISTPTLLLDFPAKEDVFREVVRSTLLDALTAAGEPLRNASAVDAVRAFARDYWSMMERPELITVLRLAIAEIPRFPELAVFHATETLERFVHAIEQVIERGIACGELRPADTRASARVVLAVLATHALWFAHPEIYGGLIGHDRQRAETATIEAIVHMLGPIERGSTDNG